MEEIKYMKLYFGLAILPISLLMFSENVASQEICVIPEQKISSIKGVVSYVDEENQVQGATVRLKRKDSDIIITETETAEDGSFQVKGNYKGKYILVVSRQNAVSLYTPIQIVKEKDDEYLRITLGAIIGESCGGGEVKLIKKSDSLVTAIIRKRCD